MVTVTDANFEASLWARVIAPEEPTLDADAARAVLALAFSPADCERMAELSGKAQAGTLTEAESAEAISYQRVGSILGLMQSKARISLKKAQSAS